MSKVNWIKKCLLASLIFSVPACSESVDDETAGSVAQRKEQAKKAVEGRVRAEERIELQQEAIDAIPTGAASQVASKPQARARLASAAGSVHSASNLPSRTEDRTSLWLPGQEPNSVSNMEVRTPKLPKVGTAGFSTEFSSGFSSGFWDKSLRFSDELPDNVRELKRRLDAGGHRDVVVTANGEIIPIGYAVGREPRNQPRVDFNYDPSQRRR